jgi:DHA2 family multidrug resistance protein
VGVLIVFRVLQGAAGGVILPLAQALLLDIHPRRAHARMLGIWGAAVMIGPVLGPMLGGVITDLASWRWIFAVNLPMAAAAVWALRGALPETAPTPRRASVDWLGIGLLTAGVGLLELGALRSIDLPRLAWSEVAMELLIGVAAALAVLLRSRNGTQGPLQADIFSDRNFAVSAAYNVLVSGMLFTTIVFVPALVEGPLGRSATDAALTIVPRGVGTLLMMLAAGHLMAVVNYRILLATGLLLSAAGLEMAGYAPVAQMTTWLVEASAVQGLGMGLLYTPLSALAFSTLTARRRTDAAGAYSLLRQFGCAFGLALMTAVLRLRLAGVAHGLASSNRAGGAPVLSPASLAALRAYGDCFKIMALVTLAILPGIFLFRRPAAAEAASDTVEAD